MAKKSFDVEITVSHGDKSSTKKYKIAYADIREAYFEQVFSDVETDEDEAYANSLEIPASKIGKVVSTIAAQIVYEAKDNNNYVIGAVELLNKKPHRRGGR